VDHESSAGSSVDERSKQFLAALALVRLAAGGVSLLKPTVLAKGLGVDSASAGRTAFIAQLFGSREIAIGLGTYYAATRKPETLRPWLVASMFTDSLDAVSVISAARKGTLGPVRSYGVAVAAVGAVAGGLATLWTLRNARRS
jgi:hypothetical protein